MSDRGANGHRSVASSFRLEAMEPRLLLTTIYGGEVFEFLDPNDQTVQVRTTGSLIIELIGATTTATGAILVDIPGTIRESTMGRSGGTLYEEVDDPYDDTLLNGGLGGRWGVMPITVDTYGTVREALLRGAPILLAGFEAPAAEIAIECIAINDAGEIWALNRLEGDEEPEIQLLRIDRAPNSEGFLVATQVGPDLYGRLQTALAGGDDFQIDAIRAADFNPINGLLYFVVSQGPDLQDRLVSLDVTNPFNTISAANWPTSFQDTEDNNSQVQSIAFDRTGANTAMLACYRTYVDEGAQTGQLFYLQVDDKPAAQVRTDIFSNSRFVVYEDDSPITTLTGIEVANDSEDGLERYVYGISSDGPDSQVILIDRQTTTLNTAIGRAIGALDDPRDPDAVAPAQRPDGSRVDGRIRGQNLTGLAWDWTSLDPFTGEQGAMIAIDIDADELVYVDYSRERQRQTDLFGIYVVKGDPNGTITISVGDDLTADDTGALRINGTIINAPSESGSVYLGVRIPDPGNNNQLTLPMLQVNLGAMGVRPAGEGTATSGLEVVKSLMTYVGSGDDWSSLLLGQNVDRVRGLAVNRSGRGYVIDSDVTGTDGLGVDGDQLYEINTDTGRALPTAYDIIHATTRESLYRAHGLDYGDPTLSGVETLYTVYEVDGDMVLGTLAIVGSDAEFTPVAVLAGIVDVHAMAFGPGQRLYMVGSTGGAARLFQVNAVTGAVTDLGALEDPLRPGTALSVNAMDFVYDDDGEAHLLAHDVYHGRLVDINVSTRAVGAVVATEVGSLNPLVGALSFDFTNQRLLAVDNSTGIYAANDESQEESAALVELSYDTGAKPQDLKRFIFGGTVTGKVDISGSVDIFYAGWLITGDLGSLDADGLPVVLPGNFHIGSDLHNLLSVSTIGTADALPVAVPPAVKYPGTSGFELAVDGRVGMIRSHLSILGQYLVANGDALTDFSSLNGLYYEIEDPDNDEIVVAGQRREIPTFSNQIGYRNDDPSGAQYLAPVRSGPGGVDSVRVQGSLWGRQSATGTSPRDDTVDYYAVPMMAGQVFGVQLVGTGWWPSSLRVGVMDPDGRIVATNYSNRDQANVREKEFRFTADRPGVYHFVVALTGDVNFDGVVDASDAGAPNYENGFGERTYELRISGVGNLALGGIVAVEHVVVQGTAVEVERGDVGAVVADLSGQANGLVYEGGVILADEGNVRAVVASSIGINPARNPMLGVGIYVRAGGDVGLLKTTDEDGVMLINQNSPVSIGGDYQVIDAAGIFNGNIIADGNIGVIRARSLDTSRGAAEVFFERSSFIAGVGGVIDLIDIVEDFGNLLMGGPHIEVGVGGNVRFIRVGGELFTETLPDQGPGSFPGSVLGWFRVAAGQTQTLTDSTGAVFYVSPTQEIINPDFNPLIDDPSEQFLDNELEVWTYRIHGTSGVAVIALKTSHGGVTIRGSGRYEIGTIAIATEDATELPAGSASSITITGGWADVFEIKDLDPEAVEDNSLPIGAIRNLTPGSIVNVNTLLPIGSLIAGGNIGLVENSTAAALNGMLPTRMPAEPQTTPQMYFPFDDQRMGVVARSFGPIWAGRAVGNVIALGGQATPGTIESVTADGDNNFDPNDDVFEGIAGPIYAADTIGTWHWEVDDRNRSTWVQGGVNIGEGIAPSGSGFRASQAGLYALYGIGPIVGRRGANIYGDIAAGHNVDIDANNPGIIASIRLDGGSIINADIMRVRDIAMTAEWYAVPISRGEAAEPDAIKNPIFDIGSVTLTGNGGIIGSVFHGPDIGNIRVDGFGIINSSFTADHGVIGNVTAAGYGIRLTDFRANFVRNLTAVGNGELLPTIAYSDAVTLSERQDYDAHGLDINRLSDLHAYFGNTDIDHRTRTGVTDAGVIEAVQVVTKELGQVTAWQIRKKTAEYNTNLTADLFLRGIRTTGIIDGLEVNAGRLGSFLPATHVYGLQLTVAGPVGSIHIYGDLAGDSSIVGSGPFGSIKSLIVDGYLDGSILAEGSVGTIEVRQDFTGDITILNNGGARTALERLLLHGSLAGSLNIYGNAGTIQSDYDLGTAADELVVNGNVASLIVGAARPSAGAVLGLDLRVQGDLSRLQVHGQIAGDVDVAGALGSLDVTKAAAGPEDLVLGAINVRRGLGKGRITNGNLAGDLHVAEGLTSLTLTNGDLAANVTAGGDIGSVSLTDGDQQAGTAITSSLGNIRSVSIVGGDLLGSVRAPHGRIESVSVTGNSPGGDVGGGCVIEAQTLGSLVVGRSVLAGASIDIEQSIDSVRIAQDLETGATLSAGSAASLTVGRDLAGAMTIGYSAAGTRLTVGRNLGADGVTAAIDANTTAVIGGDIVEGATFSVTRDLTKLQAGVLYGNLLVDGMAGTLQLQKLGTALLTVGFDLTSLTVAREIQTSAIQVGAARGADGTFAAGDRRMGRIGSLSAASLDRSVVAAGGDIDRVTVGGMISSSLSSGLVLYGGGLDSVRLGASLFPDLARDILRRSATLYRGDIGSASVGTLVSSAVTAGIKPSASGAFDGDSGSLPSSITGGQSQIRSISGSLDAHSRILADAGVNGTVTGGSVNGDVSYEIDDLLGGNALSTWRGVAGQGQSFTYSTLNGSTVTISLTGAGFVEVYDETGDNVIDDLVLRGTNSTSRLTLTTSAPASVSIGRLLSDDDCTLAAFSFDGDLIGDGTSAPDLWLDGPVSDFRVRSMGSGWNGRIGGDVALMTIHEQGAGALQVGGRIRQLAINGSTATALLENLGTAAGTQITEMAVAADGTTWVFDAATGRLGQANVAAGTVSNWKSLRDMLGAVVPAGMDFDSAGNLLAVAELYDPAPIIEVAQAMSPSAVALRGLAVSPTGQIVAVSTSGGQDRLVQINATTGGITNLGLLREVTTQSTFDGHVRQLAFDASGNLYALLSDADGTGEGRSPADGYALARLRQNPNYTGVWWASSPAAGGTNSAPVLIAGGITQDFTGLAISAGGQIWTVRRNNTDTGDVLTRLTVAGGAVTPGPDYAILADGQATNLVGIGFDQNGNLLGVSQGDTIVINTTTDPGSAAVLGLADTVDENLTAFAIGRSGTTYSTFAYDTAANGRFFTNAGLIAVLGSIDTTLPDGEVNFSRIASLLADDQATPLTAAIAGMAVKAGGNDDVYVVTDSDEGGQLYRYSSQGVLVGAGALGQVLDGRTGEALSITQLDFNDNRELVGLDATFKRLVTVATATAQATERLPSGSIPTAASVAAMAFDPDSEAFYGVTGQTFVHFLAQNRTQYDELVGGITAHGIDTLTINAPDGFYGQITTNGNSFGSVNISGTFAGILTTPGSMGAVTQRVGDFAGTLVADRGITSLKITSGSFLAGALVQTDGDLGTFSQSGILAGPDKDEFQGVIDARSVSQLSSAVDAVASALVRVSAAAGTVSFAAAFGGHLNVGSIDRSLAVRGLMDGQIDIAGGATSISLNGGASAASAITLGGDLQSLRSNGAFEGSLVVGRTLGSATFHQMSGARIIVGLGGNALSASGNVLNCLISYGTGIGADGVYNTDDDVIYGGTLRSAKFRGDFTRSALVAGVLPSLAHGPGVPGAMTAYTGDLTAADPAEADSAEAGGLFNSSIGSASFAGDLTYSAVAAADALGAITGPKISRLRTRAYGDPLGAPTVVSVNPVLNSQLVLAEIDVVFSEQVNTGSLVLAVDGDNDGEVDGPADTPGSIIVRNGQTVLDDCTLSYTVDGYGRGVLVITRAAGLGDLVSVTLKGEGPSVVVDRSGLRSALRDFDQDGAAALAEDPFGTILDGDEDGVEGGDGTFLIAGQAADNFPDALETSLLLTVDGGALSLNGVFSTDAQTSIYHFSADAYDFFSASYISLSSYALMGLFLQDTQGTADSNDDTFELVAAFADGYDLIQAFELPSSGEYFLALKGLSAGDYLLQLTLASSDDRLDGQVDGLLDLGRDVTVAYVSNTVHQHNNLLGANPPKQLVYLNFDGGETTQFTNSQGSEAIAYAFDALDFNPSLDGVLNVEDLLIHGGSIGNEDVTGIIDNLVSIFTNTPAYHPLGQLSVQVFDAADLAGIASLDDLPNGITFTTVDPRSVAGFGADVPFSTGFIGEIVASWVDNSDLGLASNIDPANMLKTDEFVVMAQNYDMFAIPVDTQDPAEAINRYSLGFAFTVAHELGHTLGLNHQPTDARSVSPDLSQDDPADGRLSAQNAGAGVGNVAGLADFRIAARNGATFDIDIDGDETVQDVVDRINAATAGVVTAAIDWQAARLTLTDSTGSNGSLAVTALNGSTAADDLGILAATDPSPAPTVTLTGAAKLTTLDTSTGLPLMAYPAPATVDEFDALAKLGTANLTSTEFGIGQIDCLDLLLRWLA